MVLLFLNLSMYVYTYMHTYIHTCLNIYISVCLAVGLATYLHVYIRHTHIHIHNYILTHAQMITHAKHGLRFCLYCWAGEPFVITSLQLISMTLATPFASHVKSEFDVKINLFTQSKIPAICCYDDPTHLVLRSVLRGLITTTAWAVHSVYVIFSRRRQVQGDWQG